MPSYDVVLRRTEVWEHVISIEADSKEEAMSRAENGEGADDDDPQYLDVIHTEAVEVR